MVTFYMEFSVIARAELDSYGTELQLSATDRHGFTVTINGPRGEIQILYFDNCAHCALEKYSDYMSDIYNEHVEKRLKEAAESLIDRQDGETNNDEVH